MNSEYKFNLENIDGNNRVSELEKEFSYFAKIKEKYEEITLLKNQKGDVIMMKNKILKNDSELKKFIENIKLKNSLDYVHIHNLLDVSIYKNSGLCSINYIIKLYYEYSNKNLKDELEDKKRENSNFNNVELTHFLYQLGLANLYLEQKNLFSGDIKPENIFYDKENLILKLTNRWEEREQFYEKIEFIYKRNLISNNNVYISPKLFKHLKRPDKNFVYDKNKEDVFAVGLLILTMGLNEDAKKLYNYNEGTFDLEKFNSWLELFQEKFILENNQLLITTVDNMLLLEESERPNFEFMFSKMPKYEQIIEHFNNLQKNDEHLENNGENLENSEIEMNGSNIKDESELKKQDDEKIDHNFQDIKNGNYVESKMENHNTESEVYKIENFPPLPEGVDIEMNEITYLWDKEYKRHYYFDSKINDYEWYYDNEELELLKKNEL